MPDLSATCGIYLLARKHLPTVQLLAGDPAIAATTRVPHPYPADGAEQFFAAAEAQRADGTGRVFAIEDDGRLVGVCGLHRITGDDAELGCWVGRPDWGRGYATFAVPNVLRFAFVNLQLASVHAEALETNVAAHRVLTRCGFLETGRRPHGEAKWSAEQLLVHFAITPSQWRACQDAPALAVLHPTLRAILCAELAAGNEIRDSSSGWPDADSVVITMRHPFRALPSPLPAGVEHREINDPHWWKAELALQAPRQLLVH